MARELFKLSAPMVRKTTKAGRYGDGGGLYLFVQPNGNRSWIFRWRDRTTGKLRDKGLGPAWDVSLEEARASAKACREQVRAGGDPIADARAANEARRLKAATRQTFAQCAERYIAAHRAGWRNEKHAGQWSATLATYAAPINPLPVDAIDTVHVLACLEPHWANKTETMTRVRQRIEAVLDWATARKLRTGENPARWKGHLDKLLPKRSKVRAVQHREALAYAEMGAFMAELRQRNGLAARCLELQILTATRPGETAGAQWAEIDTERAVWTIPGERMKAGKEHRVPLSARAVELLKGFARDGDHVFPGVKGQPLTTAAGMKLLKEMRPGITAHGFRSSFRDWAGETTAHPREVIEHALAHQLKDKAEAAYQRGDLFERRRRLMDDWARYCDAPAGHNRATVAPVAPTLETGATG
ncbi:MAG: integrase arm-type DNA-binding domain-containing protein, partial [Rhodanobacteraceae bacterium]|nr:integrase arm-type DNA-binding domain-containing protein [Rhodanobacteraceae bacterium]